MLKRILIWLAVFIALSLVILWIIGGGIGRIVNYVRTAPDPSAETAPGILVIRMSSLGDIILTAPVLRNLRRRWPDARITMLVKPQFAAAAAKSKGVWNRHG